MKPVLKGFLHLFVSSAIVGAANTLLTGAPITSGRVLIPSALAGALAVGHAAFPSIIGAGQAQGEDNGVSTQPPPVSNFPSSR